MAALAAHEEALLASGYQRPGPEYDDGTRLLGRRIWVDGHGPGLCCKFQRAMVGASSHLVRLDETGMTVELKLERKGNGQLRWLLGPSAAESGTPVTGSRTSSDATVAPVQIALPPSPPLVSKVLMATARENSTAADAARKERAERLKTDAEAATQSLLQASNELHSVAPSHGGKPIPGHHAQPRSPPQPPMAARAETNAATLTTRADGMHVDIFEADHEGETAEQQEQSELERREWKDSITAEIDELIDLLSVEEETTGDSCSAVDAAANRRRMERVLECDVMDEHAVQQLDVEVFSDVRLDWVKAKITKVHVDSIAVDVAFVEPQCGQYCQKRVRVVDSGRFRCAAFSNRLRRQSSARRGSRLRSTCSQPAVVMSSHVRNMSVPNVPIDLSADGPDQDNKMTVAWTVPCSSEQEKATSCELDWGPWYIGSWNTITVPAAATNTWKVVLQNDTLQPGYNLVLRVRARNARGCSKFSTLLYQKLGTDGGGTGAEPGVDLSSTLSHVSSARAPVENIPIFERVFGCGSDEDSLRGQPVEIFDEEGGGWTVGTITELMGMEDETVKVQFAPIQIQDKARIWAQSPGDPSLESVWVTRDQWGIARFYREDPVEMGQDKGPFYALSTRTTRAQKANRSGQHSFHLISDSDTAVGFMPAQGAGDETQEVEVQLNDCGDKLRLPRKTRPPSMRLKFSSDSNGVGSVDSWQKALVATPLAPILMGVELTTQPRDMVALFPEQTDSAEPLSYMHGKLALNRTIACDGGEYFVTLSNSVLYFHQAGNDMLLDGPPGFNHNSLRLSMLPASIHALEKSFCVRCEHCEDVNREPCGASVMLRCRPDGFDEVQLTLSAKDSKEALRWQVGIEAAITNRTETIAEVFLQPLIQDRHAEFAKKAAAHKKAINDQIEQCRDAVRRRLQHAEEPRTLIHAFNQEKKCFSCTTVSATGYSMVLAPFVHDVATVLSTDQERDFAQILGVSPSLCAGLQVEVIDGASGRWVDRVILGVDEENLSGTSVLVTSSDSFSPESYDICDAASFRLPTVEIPQLELELEPEPEPEQTSDICERVPAKRASDLPQQNMTTMVRRIFRPAKTPMRTTTDIRDLSVEVFSSSAQVWLPGTIVDCDFSVGTVTAEYMVPSNKCGSRRNPSSAGLRQKVIPFLNSDGKAKKAVGRTLRLRPKPGAHYTASWPVRQGWVLREKSEWRRYRVVLYSDGRLTFHGTGSEDVISSPVEPGHMVIRLPKTHRKLHPRALRLHFDYDTKPSKTSWKEVVDPEDEQTERLLLQCAFRQRYPAIRVCGTCHEFLVSAAALPDPKPALRKLQELALHDMGEVDRLLSEDGKLTPLFDKWKGEMSDPLMHEIRWKMNLWIKHRIVHPHFMIARRPATLADSHCPLQIATASIVSMLDKAHGIKALLCCGDMLQLVNSVLTQTDLIAKHAVFRIEKLSPSRHMTDRLSLVEAIVYMDPSKQNLQSLEAELRKPRYKCYHVVFAGHRDVRGSAWSDMEWSMEQLVLADQFSLLRNVEVSFTGMFPASQDMFVLEGESEVSARQRSSLELQQMRLSELFDRARNAGLDQQMIWQQMDSAPTKEAMVDALIAGVQEQQNRQRLLGALLSLGKPTTVRCSDCRRSRSLAQSISDHATRDSYARDHWDELESAVGAAHASTTLLIIDRVDDVITPLVAPFTYEAAIHELFYIKRNTVQIPSLPGSPGPPTFETLNLRVADDAFWAEYAGLSFLDAHRAKVALARRLAALKAQAEDRSDTRASSVACKEFCRLKPIVATHTKLCEALRPYIETLKRMAQLQQSLMDPQDRDCSSHLNRLRELLQYFDEEHPSRTMPDVPAGITLRVCRLRVLLLFALQYQEDLWHWQGGSPVFGQPTRWGNEFLIDLCRTVSERDSVGPEGTPEREIIQRYIEVARRHDSHAQRRAVERAMVAAERQLRDGDEIDAYGPFSARPVRPRLAHTLHQLLEGRLTLERYPEVGIFDKKPGTARPLAVTVFVTGGVTVEEGRVVHALNISNQQRDIKLHVSLGGDFVTTANDFLSALCER